MKLTIKPSDLYYKYPRDIPNREQPKFSGKPDPLLFNRDDHYEVIPMLEAVMTQLGRDDERTLHLIEEIDPQHARVHHQPGRGLRLPDGDGKGRVGVM